MKFIRIGNEIFSAKNLTNVLATESSKDKEKSNLHFCFSDRGRADMEIHSSDIGLFLILIEGFLSTQTIFFNCEIEYNELIHMKETAKERIKICS